MKSSFAHPDCSSIRTAQSLFLKDRNVQCNPHPTLKASYTHSSCSASEGLLSAVHAVLCNLPAMLHKKRGGVWQIYERMGLFHILFCFTGSPQNEGRWNFFLNRVELTRNLQVSSPEQVTGKLMISQHGLSMAVPDGRVSIKRGRSPQRRLLQMGINVNLVSLKKINLTIERNIFHACSLTMSRRGKAVELGDIIIVTWPKCSASILAKTGD